MIVIGSHVAGMPLVDFAWGRGKMIPDREPAPVFVRCTLDLIGGGRRSPQKICGKRGSQFGVCQSGWLLCAIGNRHIAPHGRAPSMGPLPVASAMSLRAPYKMTPDNRFRHALSASNT